MLAMTKRSARPAPRTDRPETLRSMLSGGRPLDKGRACEVADLVVEEPRKLATLIECLWDDDPGVANRAADALERSTARKPPRLDPRLLAPWKESLLGLLADAQPNKLRWNLALTVPRIELSITEARRVALTLHGYLDDSSSIVKTAAMHGLAEPPPPRSSPAARGPRPAAHSQPQRNPGHARPRPHPVEEARIRKGEASAWHQRPPPDTLSPQGVPHEIHAAKP